MVTIVLVSMQTRLLEPICKCMQGSYFLASASFILYTAEFSQPITQPLCQLGDGYTLQYLNDLILENLLWYFTLIITIMLSSYSDACIMLSLAILHTKQKFYTTTSQYFLDEKPNQLYNMPICCAIFFSSLLLTACENVIRPPLLLLMYAMFLRHYNSANVYL